MTRLPVFRRAGDLPEQRDQEDDDAKTDRRIRQVEISGPDTNLNEVSDGPKAYAIHEVAERSTDDRAKGNHADETARSGLKGNDRQGRYHGQGEDPDKLAVPAQQPERGARIGQEAEPQPTRQASDITTLGERRSRPGLARLINREHQDGNRRGGDGDALE